jgi:thiol-disulfide isomerase/thioredoxin
MHLQLARLVKNSSIFILAALIFLIPFSISAAPAPDFTLPTGEGEMTLSNLKGQVVYLDFWASWCGPCRKSFPWMNEMQKQYKDQGLTIIAVNLDKDLKQARKFLSLYPADFTIAFDPKGDVPLLYDVKGMPTSYIIDKDGNIHTTHIGFRKKDTAELESAFQSLLNPE